MKRAKNSSVDNLRGPVVRSVSRRFYLSIRLLPATLRDPIALAYYPVYNEEATVQELVRPGGRRTPAGRLRRRSSASTTARRTARQARLDELPALFPGSRIPDPSQAGQPGQGRGAAGRLQARDRRRRHRPGRRPRVRPGRVPPAAPADPRGQGRRRLRLPRSSASRTASSTSGTRWATSS